MAKQAQYVSRPCKALDSPALWDWLESEHPGIMSRFIAVFNHEIERRVRGVPPYYHKLDEHVVKFMGEPK